MYFCYNSYFGVFEFHYFMHLQEWIFLLQFLSISKCFPVSDVLLSHHFVGLQVIAIINIEFRSFQYIDPLLDQRHLNSEIVKLARLYAVTLLMVYKLLCLNMLWRTKREISKNFTKHFIAILLWVMIKRKNANDENGEIISDKLVFIIISKDQSILSIFFLTLCIPQAPRSKYK